jgi:antitoxin component of MazEF toxin-antitoxin module
MNAARESPVIKTLTRHGNSLALVIEKPILELLGADADTPFEITTDGRALILTPATDPARREKFGAALEQGNARYADMLKKLAE